MIDHDKRKLRMAKWGGECSLEVDYAGLGVHAHVKGDLFALDIILEAKPAVNSWTFPFKTKGLRFSYQPPLTQKEIDQGCIRPPNVVGSYAVYHKTKRHNQYGTGKFGHIYTPETVDAEGRRTWCGLHINKYINPTLMTVTVPQEFLDEAVYPVTVDPDFGYDIIGLSYLDIADGPLRAGSAWPMPAPGGTANWIKAAVGGAAAHDCKVFINEKDSGGAGTHGQIAASAPLNCHAGAPAWEQFNLAGEVLTAAVVYILNISTEIGASGYSLAYDDDDAVASYSEGQTYCAEESPWVVNPEGTTRDYGIYCDYTDLVLGWTGKISGVTDPAEVMGVPVADIASVKGVA